MLSLPAYLHLIYFNFLNLHTSFRRIPSHLLSSPLLPSYLLSSPLLPSYLLSSSPYSSPLLISPYRTYEGAYGRRHRLLPRILVLQVRFIYLMRRYFGVMKSYFQKCDGMGWDGMGFDFMLCHPMSLDVTLNRLHCLLYFRCALSIIGLLLSSNRL